MRKFFVAILALLYITTSTGATMHLHYCMGKLADWGLGEKDSKKCSRCGMEKTAKKDKGCCRDENKFLKNDTDQKTTDLASTLIPFIAIAIPLSFIEIPSYDFYSVTEEKPTSHAPPGSSSIAVYIRNCVFLI